MIDTGIRTTHSEFTGRIGDGFSALIGDGSVEDCHGHGTHVASTVAGTRYGVAKKATIHAVRVLDCAGHGTYAEVIHGMSWVRDHGAAFPSVANMSLGGARSAAVDTAVRSLTGDSQGSPDLFLYTGYRPYQQFSLHTGTPLHPTDGTFEFAIAQNRDVFAIKKSGTGTGTTEVHVLSAASGYQQFSLHTGTPLHPTDNTFAFAVARNRDVFVIKKSGTGTGTTEIHVLSAASGYQQFSLHTGTPLHPTDGTFEFAVAENRDVFVIKKSGTGTGTTEIHVLSAASGYQQFSLHTGTALHPTDGTFELGVAENRDVFAIKKSGTGTGTTEIHVLSAASGYQQFSLHTGTPLHPTDDTFEFAVAENRDVFAIKKSGTGTGSTEIHVLAD